MAVFMLGAIIRGNAYYMKQMNSLRADSETRFKFNWNICNHKISDEKKLRLCERFEFQSKNYLRFLMNLNIGYIRFVGKMAVEIVFENLDRTVKEPVNCKSFHSACVVATVMELSNQKPTDTVFQ